MDFEQAVKQTANEFVEEAAITRETPQGEEEMVAEEIIQPVDVWQNRQIAMRERPQARVRGASPQLLSDLEDLMQGGIDQAYKKAIHDSELLRAEGENQYATIVEQQYMQNYFLPLVDALIRLNSQEEVLASQDALETLDALAIVPGGGRADGYTSVFVSSLYEPVEGRAFRSDVTVREAIKDINRLCDNKQISSAVRKAAKTLEAIDYGSARATSDDYEFLSKIVLRG